MILIRSIHDCLTDSSMWGWGGGVQNRRSIHVFMVYLWGPKLADWLEYSWGPELGGVFMGAKNCLDYSWGPKLTGLFIGAKADWSIHEDQNWVEFSWGPKLTGVFMRAKTGWEFSWGPKLTGVFMRATGDWGILAGQNWLECSWGPKLIGVFMSAKTDCTVHEGQNWLAEWSIDKGQADQLNRVFMGAKTDWSIHSMASSYLCTGYRVWSMRVCSSTRSHSDQNWLKVE